MRAGRYRDGHGEEVGWRFLAAGYDAVDGGRAKSYYWRRRALFSRSCRPRRPPCATAASPARRTVRLYTHLMHTYDSLMFKITILYEARRQRRR